MTGLTTWRANATTAQPEQPLLANREHLPRESPWTERPPTVAASRTVVSESTFPCGTQTPARVSPKRILRMSRAQQLRTPQTQQLRMSQLTRFSGGLVATSKPVAHSRSVPSEGQLACDAACGRLFLQHSRAKSRLEYYPWGPWTFHDRFGQQPNPSQTRLATWQAAATCRRVAHSNSSVITRAHLARSEGKRELQLWNARRPRHPH